MHHTQIKSAVSKYKGFRTIVSKPELEKIVAADDKGYSAEDVAEILAALEKEPVTPIVDTALKNVEAQSNLKWFDEFHVRIEKKMVRNALMGKQETIIVGWSLEKKLMPKFIEPTVAKHLNGFADGYDPTGMLLLPKDEAKTGDLIPYKVWADEMGRNPNEDINQLLNK